MDLDYAHAQSPDQPKRRRPNARKRHQRAKGPISARLALDPQLRGNVGVLSDDLANDLFQGVLNGECGLAYDEDSLTKLDD